MTKTDAFDFDVDALYRAMDEKRRAAGLSWQAVAREVSRPFETTTSRPIAASTISGMRTKRAIEGDSVLQQLRWLHRTPESFVPGGLGFSDHECALPTVPSNKILRFDTRAIYSALDAQRGVRELTWKQVAQEIGGFQPAALTRFAKGGRTGFPDVIRIARWLGRPIASLTRITSR